MSTHTTILLLSEARLRAANGQGASLRQAAGLSQADIARATGSTRGTISRWEAGLRRPHGAPAVRWAQLLRELKRLQEVVSVDESAA